MKHSIPFYGTVTASATTTFVSQFLGFPYVLEKIRVKFALGHVGLVQHKFFVSPDNVVVTSGTPNGINVLSQNGQVDYLVGDDDVLEIQDQTDVKQRGTWLKVLAINADTANHTVNVIITIDDLLVHPGLAAMVRELKAAGLTLIPGVPGVDLP